MQIVNHSASIARFDDISIQTIAVGNGRHLFSYNNDTTKGDKIISSVSAQGVCTTRELREMKNGGKVVQPSYFVIDDNTKAQIIKTGKQFFFDGKNKNKNTNVFDYVSNFGNIDMIITMPKNIATGIFHFTGHRALNSKN